MIVRHSETRGGFEPSVRFYRTIALSFLAVTIILLATIVFATTKKATITIIAKEDVKNAEIRVDLGAGEGNANVVSGAVSSSVFSWTERFYPTTFQAEDAVATGTVVIYNKSDLTQPLVKTTRLLSADNVLFRLQDRVVVPAGGQVIAEVYADQAGAKSEIGPSQFVIPGLSSDRQKFIYAESTQAMSGGTKKAGVLTDADLKSAQSIYSEKVKQNFIKQLPSYGEGFEPVVAVVAQEVSADKKSGETVDNFSLSGSNSLVVVWYKRSDLLTIVSNEIGSKVDLSLEKVLSVSGDPLITLASYDLSKGTAQLSVSQQARVTLDPDGEKISAAKFLDQSKDEIERYLVGLEHVSGVEVKFSPSWVMKSPNVADHIKVIIKNVK